MRRAAPIALGLALVFTAAAPAGLAAASSEDGWCGTHPAALAVAVARHRYFQRHPERLTGPLPAKSHGAVRQAGEIAVIEDDGSLFIAPKAIDLQGASMQFLRRPKGASAVRSPLDFKTVLGDKLEIGDDDSFFVEFPEGFRYPFGDEEAWAGVWVNSDGNLTFGRSDSAATARSLSRFLDGPPRIAPLFTDLDPSAAAGDGGLYLRFLPGRVRLTWWRVPEFGAANSNSVQITLFTTGRVTFVYGDDVEAATAVVGVNPFAGSAPLHLMDYNAELPFRPQRTAIAEWFPDAAPQFDSFSFAFRFFQNFKDVYDQLIVWYDFASTVGTNQVLGRAFPLKANVQGIGDGFGGFAGLLGSRGRLESFVEIAGSIRDFPDDPDAPANIAGESKMSLTAHEVGHRWLSRLHFRDGAETSNRLLGRGQAHWSFFMDSDASVMEGNEIQDNGDGTFLTLGPTASRYSALDQYAMGLIPPQAVPPFFYVEGANAGEILSAESNPRAGVTITGTRRDLTIDDVIAAEGERLPRSADAPKVFKLAFILVGGPGSEVPQASIDKLDRYRRRFQSYFEEATSGNGQVITRLQPRR